MVAWAALLSGFKAAFFRLKMTVFPTWILYAAANHAVVISLEHCVTNATEHIRHFFVIIIINNVTALKEER